MVGLLKLLARTKFGKNTFKTEAKRLRRGGKKIQKNYTKGILMTQIVTMV